MKSSISLLLVIICTVVLAAQQSQAKKGCNAYGHACYGGHGKRSLSSATSNNVDIDHDIGTEILNGVQPDAVLQLLPNEAAHVILSDGEFDTYPKYRLIKIIKSWFGSHMKRPMERISNTDYSISDEAFSRDGSNISN